MRALFREHSNSLKDGTYIFVAKVGLFDASHEELTNDFKKVLTRAKTLT
jgi:ribonuclease P protein component